MSLALGIGANTTIYSFKASILLRSLPVAGPESLVVLNWHSVEQSAGEDLRDHGGGPQTANRPDSRWRSLAFWERSDGRVTTAEVFARKRRRSEALRVEMELHLAEEAAEFFGILDS